MRRRPTLEIDLRFQIFGAPPWLTSFGNSRGVFKLASRSRAHTSLADKA